MFAELHAAAAQQTLPLRGPVLFDAALAEALAQRFTVDVNLDAAGTDIDIDATTVWH